MKSIEIKVGATIKRISSNPETFIILEEDIIYVKLRSNKTGKERVWKRVSLLSNFHVLKEAK